MTEEHAPELVEVSRDGPVAVVTLSFIARRNALGQTMREALRDVLQQLMYRTPDVRALVLTGAGGHFCAGADLSEMKTRTIPEGRHIFDTPTEVVRLLVGGPHPVIAAVEGCAFGAGMALAAACDHVVAARNARFCAAFLRVGLLPDTGLLWTLPHRVGAAKARELMSLASEIDGSEAARIGMANEATEPGSALAAALEVAHRYAKLPPSCVMLTKDVLAHSTTTLEQTLRAEIEVQPVARQSADHLEAVAAFIQKRPPVFTSN